MCWFVVHVPQAVVDHAVDGVEAAHLDAAAQAADQVRRVGHRLHAAGDAIRHLADRDGARGGEDGLEARAAHLVDGDARHALGQAGAEGGLAGRGLALTGGQDAAHVDPRPRPGSTLGALERGLDRDRAELGGGHGGQRAEEAADGGAGCADDDDVTHTDPPETGDGQKRRGWPARARRDTLSG
jgi:hypothetical protein